MTSCAIRVCSSLSCGSRSSIAWNRAASASIGVSRSTSAITSAERTTAGRTLTILADGNDAIALLLKLGVLGTQRLALCLRLLTIAYPFRATGFQESLRIFQLDAFLLQLERRLLLQCRSALDL